jgi:hypothetical protein
MRLKTGKWSAGLYQHHDHGRRWDDTVLLCGGCNSADGDAKLKLGLPEDFSFCVYELRKFVEAFPHSGPIIDYSEAREVYKKIDLSKKIVGHDPEDNYYYWAYR